jgi:class 3 adenylate cyclase/tetratricopeptide (TPR) repeat protein
VCGAEQSVGGPREERKLVSILFVDQVGSTSRADGADPEDVRDRNQLYYQEARGRIEDYDGVVEKYVGDAVMAVYGAPLARVDDAERAVRAALAVLDGVHRLNAEHPGLDLEVRAAVCTGEAVVAIDAAPEQPLATGDVANTAARLQDAAPPGGVVIGEQTYELVRGAFELKDLPPVQAKGKREPVPAWLVVRALDVPLARAVSDTPLVGRDRELQLLRSVWDRAVETARPHLVTILGPPGIGKTRLGRELSEYAGTLGGRAVWGRSLAYEEQWPYRGFGQIVRNVAGIYENDSVDVARTKLAATVADLFPETDVDSGTRNLSVLLGLGLDEPPDEVFHLRFAARTLIERLAERDPLLVVFEDVHWADEPMVELIEYLVTHVRDARVVFLALARPEFLEDGRSWGGGMIGQTTLPIEPLTTAEATAAAATLLADASASTVERIVSVAEGNPLFLEELAASFDEERATDELPTTVLAAIAARIDALPASARSVLFHASVIGQTFWREVLEAMGLDGVAEGLDALDTRGLIVRHQTSQVGGDAEYAFKHALIRDVAYGTVPRTTRRQLHASIGRYLEDTLEERPDLGWLLAHHWREAGEPSRAIGYLLAAADRARDALAAEETYDLLGQALELATDDAERRRIRLRRGLAMDALEDFARADAELTSLLPDLDGRDEIEALLALGQATHWTEQADRTMEFSERALARAREQGFADLEAPALARVGAAHSIRGRPGDVQRAIEFGEQAIAGWPAGMRLTDLAELYHLQANACYWSGQYGLAHDLSVSSAQTSGSLPTSAEFVLRGGGMIGLALTAVGRYEEAIAASDAAIATAAQLGRPANVVLNYSTTALRDLFLLNEARERSGMVAERLGPSDFNMPWINARTDLLAAELLLEDFRSVERDWEGVWDDARQSTAWERWLITARLAAERAELERSTGRLDEAVTWSKRALEQAQSTWRPKYEVIARITLGRTLTAQGLAHDAVAELLPAVGIADGLGTPLLRWRARAALAEAERATGSAEAEAHRANAIEIIREVAASLAPERAERYLAAPQVREVLATG